MIVPYICAYRWHQEQKCHGKNTQSYVDIFV